VVEVVEVTNNEAVDSEVVEVEVALLVVPQKSSFSLTVSLVSTLLVVLNKPW
jgi:hypothetical protein